MEENTEKIEKCEKVIPDDVLLGIANFIDLVPCKIPENLLKKKKKEENPITELSLLSPVV